MAQGFELPQSASPWVFFPYGAVTIYVNANHPPRVFTDGALQVLEVGTAPPPPPPPPPPPGTEKPPLYTSSVVGTDFAYITGGDPSKHTSISYLGFMPFEMPDKRPNMGPLVDDAYVFAVNFSDSTPIKIASDKEFGSREAAQADAERYMAWLGRLPLLYRQKIKHVVVHKGGDDVTAFAEDIGHFFVIYSGNATKRLSTNDLGHTFFHEGTHAAIQSTYLNSPEWKAAVAADNAFITDYAKTAAQEDFAESALFAYTIIKNPTRFPAAERTKIEAQIPNRIAFFRTIFV